MNHDRTILQHFKYKVYITIYQMYYIPFLIINWNKYKNINKKATRNSGAKVFSMRKQHY